MDRIEHALFVRAPERRDEVTLGAVAGQAVDNYLRREDAQTLLEQVDIVLWREHLELSGGIIRRQIRAAQHMQQVQLDALRPALTDIARGLHHLRIRLPRQAEDLVHNDLQTGRAETADRTVKHRQIVAAADIGRDLRMDGLQAELDPEGYTLIGR